ncbi:MAG: oligosaccharide flippase family protein, partial [Candidatus Omnitrophica bacterium]|nr:oligosaccharide flippase family protein [Candidatus Omnitrophota bacterium]
MILNLQLRQNFSNKIIRNTIFNILGYFCNTLISFLLVPYIISYIGIERFGIWSIFGLITTYFGILDFGIGGSFVKYIAEFYAKEEYEKINQLINTGFSFYLLFAIFIIIILVLSLEPLLYFLKVPFYLKEETRFLFLLGIVIFGLSNVFSPFNAIQGGLQ